MKFRQEDHVFHRDFKKTYPIITHGQGVYLFDDNGKSYIDASSGAIAVNLGHGVTEIVDAMSSQAQKAAFVHTLRFETEVLHELAAEIADLAPPSLNRVYFTSGGSEANESAIKLAQQYHQGRGRSSKQMVIGRWQSYHGNTFGSLSAGGDVKRRKPFTGNLLPFLHIHPPSPSGEDRRSGKAYAEELERLIQEVGAEFISSFICEPIVGSQQGAVVPPDDYFKQMKAVCDKHDILLIIDEVMTGFGRTGTHFAVEHFGFEPDILTFGKGVSSGYAPLGGMAVHDRVIQGLIDNSDGKFVHGYTYSGHPVSAAAGLAAVRYYKKHAVLDNCIRQSGYLFRKLRELGQKHRIIGDIRGKGLLIGIELLRDRDQNLAFPASYPASERLNEICMELGAVFYPGSGAIDGIRGHHLLIGPPLTVAESEIERMADILDQAITRFHRELPTF